ncbi:MAG: DUF3883 domain-containing protein [Verrucomicrobiales bacterium]
MIDPVDDLPDEVRRLDADGEQGDGAGFDIRSFDDNGNDLFIEVKTTRFRKETPFFISSNEIRFSEANASRFSLYRVYRFNKGAKLFTLPGNIATRCALTPTTYRGSFPRSRQRKRSVNKLRHLLLPCAHILRQAAQLPPVESPDRLAGIRR